MQNRRRYLIVLLAALTFARLAYGMQFQSTGALGPSIIRDLNVSFASFGALVGAYSFLGIALSVPSGWLITWLGTKRVSIMGLMLMGVGSVIFGIASQFDVAIAGRIISGAGAVLLMVVLPTVVLEQFPAASVSVPMSIQLSGFPLGIGIGFLALPLFGSWRVAMAVIAVLSAIACLWFAVTLPSGTRSTAAFRRPWPGPSTLVAAVSAGSVWGLLNAALAVLLSFASPFLLATQSLSAHAAAALVSLAAFAIAPTSPPGAWLIDRTRCPVTCIAIGLATVAAILLAISLGAWPIGLLIAAGIVIGPIAGPIVALPGAVLSASERPMGMAMFWLAYFIPMAFLPPLAGYVRDIAGDPAAAIETAAFFPMAAMVALGLYAAAKNGLLRRFQTIRS